MKDVIFFQRPLKPQQKGKCRIYENQDRAHKCLPSSHRFRILQELCNLEIIGQKGESVSLSKEKFHQISDVLEHQKTLSFNSLRRKLGTDAPFNLESGKRDKLDGNVTSCTRRKPEFFGSLWDDLNPEEQDAMVGKIMDAEAEEEIVSFLEGRPFSTHSQSEEGSLRALLLPRDVPVLRHFSSGVQPSHVPGLRWLLRGDGVSRI